jgi:hypothetical protein
MNMELVTNIPETIFSGQFTHHTSSDDGDGVSETLDTNPCTWMMTQNDLQKCFNQITYFLYGYVSFYYMVVVTMDL